jgi:hypothetical protein
MDRVKFLQFFHELGQAVKSNRGSNSEITWFGLPRD